MKSLTHLEAPWTKEQVESLNAYQGDGIFHPFTHETDDGKKVVLIATLDGWVVERGGPIVQNWCHDWMANWAWNRTLEWWMKTANLAVFVVFGRMKIMPPHYAAYRMHLPLGDPDLLPSQRNQAVRTMLEENKIAIEKALTQFRTIRVESVVPKKTGNKLDLTFRFDGVGKRHKIGFHAQETGSDRRTADGVLEELFLWFFRKVLNDGTFEREFDVKSSYLGKSMFDSYDRATQKYTRTHKLYYTNYNSSHLLEILDFHRADLPLGVEVLVLINSFECQSAMHKARNSNQSKRALREIEAALLAAFSHGVTEEQITELMNDCRVKHVLGN